MQNLNGYWSSVPEDAAFAQGDVLRRICGDSVCRIEFGVGVTADCDIKHQKAGDTFTFVEVVTAADYVDLVWAPEQNRKFVRKQAKAAAEQISGVMKKSGLEIGITGEALVEWLREQPLEEIERAINRTGRPFDSKLLSKLRALQAAIGGDGSPDGLRRWQAVRRELGEKVAQMRSSIKELFDGDNGFPDYFLLPELPEATGYGFVALLRSIRTISAAELFGSELDARIAGRPDAWHRVGRLTDGIRFAITQKLAFLFSRIGLPEHFEDECESTLDLIAENLFVGED